MERPARVRGLHSLLIHAFGGPVLFPTGPEAGPWKDTLALLEAGFPRGRAELDARFRILAESASNDLHQVTLQPKAASARRMMPQITLTFATNQFSLHATELRFADGSTLRNEFLRPVMNPRLDQNVFLAPLDPDITVVEPLRR